MARGAATLVGPMIDEAMRVYRTVTWRLVPFLIACDVAADLDRVALGVANRQMPDDLLSGETIDGPGAGLFFPGVHTLAARLAIGGLLTLTMPKRLVNR